MKTLEDLLKENTVEGNIDFSLRARTDEKGTTTFYIHTAGINSDTLDFGVSGNVIFPVNNNPCTSESMKQVPRKNNMDLYIPAEYAIHNATLEVEKSGADPLLTDAVILLGEAQDKVATYVDKKNK